MPEEKSLPPINFNPTSSEIKEFIRCVATSGGSASLFNSNDSLLGIDIAAINDIIGKLHTIRNLLSMIELMDGPKDLNFKKMLAHLLSPYVSALLNYKYLIAGEVARAILVPAQQALSSLGSLKCIGYFDRLMGEMVGMLGSGINSYFESLLSKAKLDERVEDLLNDMLSKSFKKNSISNLIKIIDQLLEYLSGIAAATSLTNRAIFERGLDVLSEKVYNGLKKRKNVPKKNTQVLHEVLNRGKTDNERGKQPRWESMTNT